MIEKDVAVIGGGPAGLAGSIEAARAGADVLLIDENDRPGGQLFKQIHKFFGSHAHDAGIRGFNIGKKLLEQTAEAGVEIWLHSAATGLFEGNRVSVLRNEKTEVVHAKKILITTGAAENAIRFDGWTLPGVMGAGAAQTMINVNRVLPGKRVLMIGSGNVGVIVAYQLLQAGADVVGIVEAMPRIGGYGVHAAKIRRAGVPFFLEHTVIQAKGDEKVEQAVIAKLDNWQPIPGTELEVDVDVICIAAGLHPLTEFSSMGGLKQIFVPEMGGWMPWHDANMESSVNGIYLAGDAAGVEEANTAMDEGRLAGTLIAHSLGYLSDTVAKRQADEIRRRLLALRQGPFGEHRQRAKEHLTEVKVEHA